MSSTAEELASQAGQLQSTISFFKIDEVDLGRGMRKPQARQVAPAHKVAVSPVAIKTVAVAPSEVPVRVGGVALNMGDGHFKGNGGDSNDGEFERF
jgi:methyl-accepting chemotaxis protein